MSLLNYPILGLLCLFSTASALTFKQPEFNDGFANRTFWSIAQDQNQFIWLATTHNVLKYDGYRFESLDIPEDSHYKKRTLHVDASGKLWIGTEYGEVFYYQDGHVIALGTLDGSPAATKNNQLQINQITSDEQNNIYFASNHGLFIKPQQQAKPQQMLWPQQIVKNVLITTDAIYATVSNGLYQLQGTPLQPKPIKLYEFSKDEIPRVLHASAQQGVFVGTNQFLYQLSTTNHKLKKVTTLPTNNIISMASDDRRLWVGTLINGLYAIDWQTNTTSNYRHTADQVGSLSDDVIIDLLLDDFGVLFIATFDGNVSITNTNSLSFGAYVAPHNHISCMQSKVIYHVVEDAQKQLWLSTAKGVVQYTPQNQQCTHHNSISEDEHTLSYPEIRSVSLGTGQQHWVATNNGLNLLDASSGKVDRLTHQVPRLPTIFSVAITPDERLIGTESGLYRYHPSQQHTTHITSEFGPLNDAEYFAYDHDDNRQLYFATTAGIATLKEQQIQPVIALNQVLKNAELKDLHLQGKSMWITTVEHGLYYFDRDFKLLKHYQPGTDFPTNTQLMDILQSDSGELWISSLNGLYRLDPIADQIHAFYASDGLQGNTFKRGASFKNKDNKLYFGGLNGLNGFYPKQIGLSQTPPNVVITELNRFNQKIMPGIPSEGFLLEQHINATAELTLSHRDYIFGFEFAALAFADPARTRYAYQLEGLDPNWNHTNADNRKVTYTNLKSGRYKFKVKAALKDQAWSPTPKTITIHVKPAPWYTWWAIVFYICAFFWLLYIYINRKVRTQRIMAKRLQQQVATQTVKINQQNTALTELMLKKDALFANVSHEFRTPLTLIMGPIDDLMQQTQIPAHQGQLAIVKRNAKKLLKLVDQLLLLAQFSENTTVEQQAQNTHTTTQAILAAYEHAVSEKNLTVNTDHLHDVNVMATQQALEIILGNLISNAIKYTPTGGHIDIESTLSHEQVTLCVKDSGTGLTEAECATIFERFARLSQNQTIEGVGLGLAISQEVAKANNSIIQVSSKPGHGSTFSVTFELTSLPAEQATAFESHNPDQSQTPQPLSAHRHEHNKDTVLIIEDNADMRRHLIEVLSPLFNTLTAADGQVGLAMALETIPDIILCDVMMPQMDGFEVCRMLRSDPLTSHIPLVLLTALDESKSRIKGWRENIDMYVTKPFVAQELRLQLNNILNIRKIINQNVRQTVIHDNRYTDLSEMDQTFIQKLKNTIETHHHQASFGLAEMAQQMFKSERHLQRKSKALIGLSPTELLREYRLNQGAKHLVDGHSVAATAELCGFNSVTYFASTFKKKYGHSPKQYQNLHKRHSQPKNL